MKRLHLHALARCAVVLGFLAPAFAPAVHADPSSEYSLLCSRGSPLCPDISDSAASFGHYIGHDEPSVLFYSNGPGSGNSTRYQLRSPSSASRAPTIR